MKANTRVLATALFALVVVPQARASIIDFGTNFSASQSLWESGASAGFDESARTSGSVGLYYEAKANSGTVNATVDGKVQATFNSMVSAGSLTELDFAFIGYPAGSNFNSAFGASIETGVFLDISGCLGATILGSCVGIPYNIDTDIGVIDEGFFLDPGEDFTAQLDKKEQASQAVEAAGVGSADLIIGELGPSIDLDLDQTIELTPTQLSGKLTANNLSSAQSIMRDLLIDTTTGANVSLDLGVGTWDISLTDFVLDNVFSNDIDLELRPNFDYIVGSWPPVGSGLFAYDLVDETFALNFNAIGSLGSFQVTVKDTAGVPVPGTLGLIGLGLCLVSIRRRQPTIKTTA